MTGNFPSQEDVEHLGETEASELAKIITEFNSSPRTPESISSLQEQILPRKQAWEKYLQELESLQFQIFQIPDPLLLHSIQRQQTILRTALKYLDIFEMQIDLGSVYDATGFNPGASPNSDFESTFAKQQKDIDNMMNDIRNRYPDLENLF